ncbi:MAG: methionyl-tRNA formyltransferase [Parcubacteria group bacterium]|nr:methionyl-tRNA formyltransferase [Parcubacteria group bacterium]
MKYVFFGTPDFAVTILEHLIEAGYVPSAIVTNPDRPVGRKHTITPPLVKKWILEQEGLKDIPVFQPEKLSEIKDDLAALEPDIFIVAAYGKLIPKSVLDIPKHGSLNVHPSLLPKYRGPTPIQTAILNGDKETGVTIMLLDEKMDHGQILKISKYEFPRQERGSPEAAISNYDYPTLSKELAELGAKTLIDVIPDWLEGKIKPVPQDDALAIYTKIYKGEDGLLDFNKPAEELDCKVRALNQEPGTYFMKDGKRIKVLKAHVENNVLILDTIQIEGKKPMSGSLLGL